MTYTIDKRQGLPVEMQALLRDYPRDAWPDHPNFARSIDNWMGAHQMFRQLAELVGRDAEAFLDKDIAPDGYAERLGFYGNLLVRNLHGHHTWEDREYFPELMQADDRFEAGLEMLEADHMALDGLLDKITGNANRAIKLSALDPVQMMDEVGPLHVSVEKLQGFLGRHLVDEEDLIVPILLHHKMRG